MSKSTNKLILSRGNIASGGIAASHKVAKLSVLLAKTTRMESISDNQVATRG